MAGTGFWRGLWLTRLSKPASERSIYRHVLRHRPATILEFGLGTPHKEVIESPAVQEAFSQWKDLEIAAIQQETATTRDVAKTMWFPEWDWYMMGEVQDYIRGVQDTDQVIDKLHAKAVELKAQYPE